MKTIEDKAMFIVNLVNEDLTDYGIKFEAASELMKALINLLKEHERDTRHACAESVGNCVEKCPELLGDSIIFPENAHAAIMNTKVE